MVDRVSDWVSETTATIGYGDIVLHGQTNQSQALFRDDLVAGDVYYSIVDGINREVGVGYFNGTNGITRGAQAVMLNGAYTITVTPLQLSGTAVVSCTMSAQAMNNLTLGLETQTALLSALRVEFDAYVAAHP